jgi:methylamine--corrinoid protein Co-methyltransferase
MCLYEIAAQRLAAISSGISMESLGAGKAKHEDYLTPMEPRFAAEVAHATVGIKRKAANDIVKSLLPKYEDKVADPPRGFKYKECYDTRTGKPSKKCLDVYNKVKRELQDLGLEFKH